MNERQARAKRRAARRERSLEEGPTPHRGPKKKTSTDVSKTAAAHRKRQRRAARRLEDQERTREGQRNASADRTR